MNSRNAFGLHGGSLTPLKHRGTLKPLDNLSFSVQKASMNLSTVKKRIPGKIFSKVKPPKEDNYDKKYIPDETIVTEIEHKKYVMAQKELDLQR